MKGQGQKSDSLIALINTPVCILFYIFETWEKYLASDSFFKTSLSNILLSET